MVNRKGKMIVFEGIDDSGKTTQATLLGRHFYLTNKLWCSTFEPTHGCIGKTIRKVLHGEECMDEYALSLLFSADKCYHVNNMLLSIDSSNIIICERFHLSPAAYRPQYAHIDDYLTYNIIKKLKKHRDIYTIFLNVSPENALNRIDFNRQHRDRYKSLDILKKVQSSYNKIIDSLSKEERKTTFIINANNSINEVQKDVYNITKQFILKQ